MMALFKPLIGQFPVPIGEQLRDWATRFAANIALVDNREALSYQELNQRVDRLAAGLSALGLRSGERVIVQLPNRCEFVTLLFALLRLGAVPVLAISTQSAHDIEALIELTQSTAWAIPGESYAELAHHIRKKHPCLRHLLMIDIAHNENFTALSSLTGERCAWPQPDVADTALLLLSGGTTGTPKLIPRKHADYSYNFSASAQLCDLNEKSVYLAVLPVAHNFALACPGILGTLSCGGKVVLADQASCDEAMPLIAKEKVTHVALVPALAQLWVAAREWENSDISSLRIIQAGGAKLDPALAEKIISVFGCTLQQVYGMAEGLVCYTRPDDPMPVVLHSQGRPLSPYDEVRIVDDDENDVVPGETGQLLTRGPYTFSGYYLAPTHNAQVFTAEGFYRSGDSVRCDAAGNIHVEGRIKELINRAGEKIAAAEVESMLMRLPDIKDYAVVAAPDPLLGERICAFIIPAQTRPTIQQLRQRLCDMGLSACKIPDQYEFLDCWPLTALGKIDKKRLVGLAAERYNETFR